jgi:ribosome biogenesis GTPase
VTNSFRNQGFILAKRKLSKQQTERVQKRRQAGGDVPDSTLADHLLGPEQEGLVLSHYGKHADVEDANGTVVRCHLRANLGNIVAGDKVIWRAGGDGGVVTALFPRSSELHRPDAFGKLKLVAANVTQMVIVVAPEPQAHANLIDRYLVVAENLELEPLLLANKADLLTDDDPLAQLLADYRALGYATSAISARTGQGMAELRSLLAGKTSIFVGQSGVGKSSVIQSLLPHESIKVGELSEQELKGRHTTTHARLYHFPFGGDCIDSPGIREFGLWHLSAQQVEQGFREFRQHIQNCRFRDCSHNQEPGCALREAVENGTISAARFQSYRQILISLDSVEMRT